MAYWDKVYSKLLCRGRISSCHRDHQGIIMQFIPVWMPILPIIWPLRIVIHLGQWLHSKNRLIMQGNKIQIIPNLFLLHFVMVLLKYWAWLVVWITTPKALRFQTAVIFFRMNNNSVDHKLKVAKFHNLNNNRISKQIMPLL